MNDAVDRVLPKHFNEQRNIEYIALDEREFSTNVGNVCRTRRPVESDRVLSTCKQKPDDMRADEAGPDDQRAHAIVA
jgi:hypothetical protein